MSDFEPKDRVRYGFRTGRVLYLSRRVGMDGAVVSDEARYPGDGTMPHWVPLTSLEKIPEEK